MTAKLAILGGEKWVSQQTERKITTLEGLFIFHFTKEIKAKSQEKKDILFFNFQ